MGGLIVVYVLGVITSAFACGLADEAEMSPLAIFWPLLLLVGLIFGPILLIAKLGEGRR